MGLALLRDAVPLSVLVTSALAASYPEELLESLDISAIEVARPLFAQLFTAYYAAACQEESMGALVASKLPDFLLPLALRPSEDRVYVSIEQVPGVKIPAPHVPIEWSTNKLQSMCPRGLLISVPGRATLADVEIQLFGIANREGVGAAGTEKVVVKSGGPLVVDGVCICVGDEIVVEMKGALPPRKPGKLVALLSAELWVDTSSTGLMVIPLSKLASGDVRVQLSSDIDATLCNTQARHCSLEALQPVSVKNASGLRMVTLTAHLNSSGRIILIPAHELPPVYAASRVCTLSPSVTAEIASRFESNARKFLDESLARSCDTQRIKLLLEHYACSKRDLTVLLEKFMAYFLVPTFFGQMMLNHTCKTFVFTVAGLLPLTSALVCHVGDVAIESDNILVASLEILAVKLPEDTALMIIGMVLGRLFEVMVPPPAVPASSLSAVSVSGDSQGFTLISEEGLSNGTYASGSYSASGYSAERSVETDDQSSISLISPPSNSIEKGPDESEAVTAAPMKNAASYHELNVVEIISGLLRRLLQATCVLEWSEGAKCEFYEKMDSSLLCRLLLSHVLHGSITDLTVSRAVTLELLEIVEVISSVDELCGLLAPMRKAFKDTVQRAETFRRFAGSRAVLSHAPHLERDGSPGADVIDRLLEVAKAVGDVLDTMSQPEADEAVDSSYTDRLSPLRVCTSRILDSRDNFYAFSGDTTLAEPPDDKKMRRLAGEISDAKNSLPCDPTNAVFVRIDAERVDVLKVMLTGVEGTPYTGGCFVFDVLCPSQYPQTPPKVAIETTARGSVRFNPNLYANGKVCLSLLGTWEGDATESWDPSRSLTQVFTSIQSLVMTADVYFNEPTALYSPSSLQGQRLNRGYVNVVRYGTVVHAMIEQIRTPPAAFVSAIRAHFFCRRKAIIKMCRQWVQDVKDQKFEEVAYDEIVAQHNPGLAAKFAAEPKAYSAAISHAVEELEVILRGLGEPDADESDDFEGDEGESGSESKSGEDDDSE